MHPVLEATGAPRFGKSRRGGVVDGMVMGWLSSNGPENTKGVTEIQTSLFHVVSFLATSTNRFVDVEKVWKDSCDLSLPLRCCVVSWKRAAMKARLSRLLMYTEIWQVSSIINEVCRHPGTACHEGKHPLWELTRSFQTAFCTGSNYSSRINMKCAYISIYNIYWCYYILWIILEDDWFLIFHDNLQQFLEASQRQKCLTTSPGSTWGTLATLAAGQRGTLWHGQPGSLRSWNPSVSWREIFRRFFF